MDSWGPPRSRARSVLGVSPIVRTLDPWESDPEEEGEAVANVAAIFVFVTEPFDNNNNGCAVARIDANAGREEAWKAQHFCNRSTNTRRRQCP